MRIIDSHVHVGMNYFCNQAESKLQYNLENRYDDFSKEMNLAGITGACILPIPDMAYDILKGNDYLLEAYQNNSSFIPICRMDNNLGRNLNNGFCGAKLHCVYETYPHNKLFEYLRMLAYYDKPLIIHAKFKDKVKQVKALLKIAPDLKIVLAHMGRGHIYTSEGVIDNVKALLKYENVFFETSTVGNSETILEACKLVGSDRILFGSDYPFGKSFLGKNYSYKDDVNMILQSPLSDIDKEKIMYRNAMLLFRPTKIKSDSYVTQYTERYKNNMENLFKSLSEQDKKFLAISNKMKIIRDCMRKEKHLFVIIKEETFVGYIRESGRNNGVSLLEELAILPEYRRKNLSKIAIDFYKYMYPSSIVKSNSNNNAINHILKNSGYKYTGGLRILNWESITNK